MLKREGAEVSRRLNNRNFSKADDGIRTRDLRFTKPLLYQLSYVGGKRAKHCIQRRLTQARSCSRFAVRSVETVPQPAAKPCTVGKA